MDLRVSQRSGRSGSIPTTINQQPVYLDHFPLQPCGWVSKQQLQRHVRFNRDPCEEEDKEKPVQQLRNKAKSQQSAIASSAVKKKLQEVILKKRQQAAQERIRSSPASSSLGRCRELPLESDAAPEPFLLSPPAQPPSETPKHPLLRRTASEPSLKFRPKKHLARMSPLARKESTPGPAKHATSEPLDSSASSSSTPASGSSSPNDSLAPDNGVLPPTVSLAHEDDASSHFRVHTPCTMPTISLGRPANSKSDRTTMLPGAPQVYVPLGLEEIPVQTSSRLQPMVILEPSGLLRTQLLTVHGPVPCLADVPLQFSSQAEFLVPQGQHKLLSRTRSEPLPQSPQSVHTQLLQAHLSKVTLPHHRLCHHTLLGTYYHLSKLMWKSSEKPRLGQIPSEEMDSEEAGQERGDASQGRPRMDLLREAELASGGERRSNLQQKPLLSQSLLWEQLRLHSQRQAVHLEAGPIPMVLRGTHRTLSRTQSSPASTSLSLPDKALSLPTPENPSKPRFTTGLMYDSQMLKHQCNCGDNSSHPEHAGRIQSILSRLQERGLRNQCEIIQGKKASLEELQLVHSEKHVLLYGTNPLNRLKLDPRKLSGILSERMFVMLPCGGVGVDNDTIWNEMYTSTASRVAAGGVTELAFKVATGELKNGFAVVRPPGHHATHSAPMGFCFFNSVAIAAKQLQHKLNASKILIVDWDVHHGNGTQETFYSDPSVLFISLHRYDDGNFFPGSGGPTEVGSGTGEGFNVNVAWTGGLDPPMGDAEYLAAFRTVVMPIAREFSPDVVLVSSGFDAATGHPPPLGGYKVSARCFGYMTQQLMELAGGRVVLALEGGYDLTAICDASEACVSALLGIEMEPLPEETLQQKPNVNAVRSLQRVLLVHGEYWPSVKHTVHTVDLSFRQAQRHEHEENDTVTALASLSVGVLHNKRTHEEPMDHNDESF
ncbi:histone deacetylase 7-like isoform X2 [Brienomyrus brachyistius]|uniref:histone deacetylase 7-like isoform X2 n=1 Tax=Brienomyrus brachyistius TaxID=42636 RepID=UPI0020B23FA4|nr:histone deacetylase 7-like isoform X2 [Brienomyrus brachyistius]